MPDVVTSPKLSVNTPQGARIIDNPLFNYTFHPLVPSDLPDVSSIFGIDCLAALARSNHIFSRR